MVEDYQVSFPEKFARGTTTASNRNLDYRLGKISKYVSLEGRWLDCGCADGKYLEKILEYQVERGIGLDIEISRVAQANQSITNPRLMFCCGRSEVLPFAKNSMEGVLMNEVLEHVSHEAATLREVYRILKPGGNLALISPNRWFPFEGHGMRIGNRNIPIPIPLLPWMPYQLVSGFLNARNYWPNELVQLIRNAGFEIIQVESVFPVFEFYTWMPRKLIDYYWNNLPAIEKNPLLKKFGVSTMVLARKK